MFDCGYKSQYIGGQREKFVRLDDLDSTLSMPSGAVGKKRAIFNLEGLNLTGRAKKNSSKSFGYGMKVGSDGLKTIGRLLRSGVTRAVFPEDLKVSEKKIFDPQDKSLLLWNRLFVISCILAVSIDPLFFYLPVNHASNCLGMDIKLAVTTTTLQTILESLYLIRMDLEFRTAFTVCASSTSACSVEIPPEIKGLRKLKKTAGVFAESALAGAAYYLLWYMLSSHITGAFWYLFAVERNDTCWRQASYARLQQLGKDHTLGQGLETSTYPGEVLFSILIAISGLLLFALLIGNMQTYLQSLTVRVEEMRIKRRDSEQWMHHRLLPQDLRERVRLYDQYKWLETRGVDEESLVQSLPKDLRRDIKRHLCLNLVRRCPILLMFIQRV
ncbi:hypothetical protein CMV_002577 [Castanea mollissima]|uniref:Ion transport domain-containing protein n=1 Tax=Castanea mollissima TaxID=60419 RepID=A0A8J4VXF2_9ROSI|nr:hypothetical protein CMV_002577 [Castanea mollissima]